MKDTMLSVFAEAKRKKAKDDKKTESETDKDSALMTIADALGFTYMPTQIWEPTKV